MCTPALNLTFMVISILSENCIKRTIQKECMIFLSTFSVDRSFKFTSKLSWRRNAIFSYSVLVFTEHLFLLYLANLHMIWSISSSVDTVTVTSHTCHCLWNTVFQRFRREDAIWPFQGFLILTNINMTVKTNSEGTCFQRTPVLSHD